MTSRRVVHDAEASSDDTAVAHAFQALSFSAGGYCYPRLGRTLIHSATQFRGNVEDSESGWPELLASTNAGLIRGGDMGATGTQEAGLVLPMDWQRAPLTYLRTNRASAIVFFGLNLFLGALGIYAPIIISALTDQNVLEAVFIAFDTGAIYSFAIPFLCACAGFAFESMVDDEQQITRNRKVVLVLLSVPVLIFCVLFLTVQISPGEKAQPLNYCMQLLTSLLAITLGIYMYAIVKNDLNASVADDINAGARGLNDKAQNATPKPGDFE